MKTILLFILVLLVSCGGGGDSTRTVSFYGDSITSGTHSADPNRWSPATWSPSPVQHIAQLAGVQGIDYSHDGASSADATIHPDASTIAVIRFGVADSVRGMAPDAFAANITRLVGQARAQGKDVILTGLTHAASVDTQPLDNVMRERAQALGVRFVDVRALGPGALADALHPGEDYSRRIGEAIAQELRTIP